MRGASGTSQDRGGWVLLCRMGKERKDESFSVFGLHGTSHAHINWVADRSPEGIVLGLLCPKEVGVLREHSTSQEELDTQMYRSSSPSSAAAACVQVQFKVGTRMWQKWRGT